MSLRTRLYAIIGFLGLLPVIGVVLTVGAVQATHRDRLGMDRATRGTIHLEHINGLVFAAVMESRGIYMSPDWITAEPFARALERNLSDLRATARAWRAVAVAAQRSNIDEMSMRLDEFVAFRTELRRLTRDVSTEAARAYGDNATNRASRSALNESLNTLARAYEDEIHSAQNKMAANDRNVLVALVALAALSLAALAGGLVLVRHGLLRPLFKMKTSMLRLAEGDLLRPIDGIARCDEIGEMARAVAVFQMGSRERRAANRERQRLSHLNEWLQSCKSLDELYGMVAEFLTQTVPDCSGSLYIYANSRDILECAIVWNGAKEAPSMHPDDCWGLRRGRVYAYGGEDFGFHCAHAAPAKSAHYCCIPILAHGETIGLLHLDFGSAECAETQRRLALVCAEQISMAIANVKLRDQLRDQSVRCALTGLYNRRYLMETCRREFARAARGRQSVSLLSIDADHFKQFNDNHGHDAGDTVLRALGDCLKECFRDDDVPCRFGGEEFVVLLPGCPPEAAAQRADELRVKIEALTVRYLGAALPRISISVGVAAYPQAGDNPQSVLKAADDALYEAKGLGRNRVEISPSCQSAGPGAGAHANPVHVLQRSLEVA